MQLGVNLPWIDCGHDFGPRPLAWGGERPERPYRALADELARQRDRTGTDVVRMWLLAGGVNYPDGADVLQQFAVGRLPDEATVLGKGPKWFRRALSKAGGWQHQRLLLGDRALPRLSDGFVEDFDSLLEAFEPHGLRLMPVLVSFEFFHPIDWQSGGVASRGRAAFVFGDGGRDRDQVGRFLDATLQPLLQVAQSRKTAIYAFEVMNEPDWSTEGGPLHARLHPRSVELMPKTVPADMMCAFLGDAVERIVEAGFLSSVGFKMADPKWLTSAFRDRLIELGARGQYVHQVHHYPSIYEPWTLKRHDTLPIRPTIIGEMPTIIGKPAGVHIAWWRERLGDIRRAGNGDEYLLRRLEIAESLGYPMALLWSARSKDMATDYGAHVIEQLARFHTRLTP